MQLIIVRLIVLFGFILLGPIAVCTAQTPAGTEVTIVGNMLEKMEKALKGVDYVSASPTRTPAALAQHL